MNVPDRGGHQPNPQPLSVTNPEVPVGARLRVTARFRLLCASLHKSGIRKREAVRMRLAAHRRFKLALHALGIHVSWGVAKRTVQISDQLWSRLDKAAALHQFSVNDAVEAAVDVWVEAHCPIPGCSHVFKSRGGWDPHVASPQKHPNWHREVQDGKKRKRQFKKEYPGWTTGASAPRD